MCRSRGSRAPWGGTGRNSTGSSSGCIRAGRRSFPAGWKKGTGRGKGGGAAVMSEMGISVSTFGVGNHFDEELMTMVAAGGGGNYRYLGDHERIVAALTSEFHTPSPTPP